MERILNKAGVDDVRNVERIIRRFQEDGINNLIVISDFDQTMTKKRDNSTDSFGVIEAAIEEISPELRKELIKLNEKYLPIEWDANMSVQEKTPFMEEWWRLSCECFIKAKVTKRLINESMKKSGLELRNNTIEFMKLLKQYGIPLIIFSAGVSNIIELHIKNEFGCLPENVFIVSNEMDFDELGVLQRFSHPIIHVFNKNATVLHKNPRVISAMANRTNVLLLGDSIGDSNMLRGYETDETNISYLKIAFLNVNSEKLLEQYNSIFDIVLVNDDTMDIPKNIIHLLSDN